MIFNRSGSQPLRIIVGHARQQQGCQKVRMEIPAVEHSQTRPSFTAFQLAAAPPQSAARKRLKHKTSRYRRVEGTTRLATPSTLPGNAFMPGARKIRLRMSCGSAVRHDATAAVKGFYVRRQSAPGFSGRRRPLPRRRRQRSRRSPIPDAGPPRTPSRRRWRPWPQPP